MFRRKDRAKEAMVAVYARPDALYLVVSEQTTDGVWTVAPVTIPPVPLGNSAPLGAAALALLSETRPLIRNPQRDEWPAHLREASAPILAQAGVRSWRALEAGTSMVRVVRSGFDYRVTPEIRSRTRADVWEEDLTHQLVLSTPGAIELGSAILSRLAP